MVLAAWTVAWLAAGLAVGHEVRGLAELSDTVSVFGRSLTASGQAIGALGALPAVGEAIGAAGERLREAGMSAAGSGRSSRESVEALSVLLGLAVAIIPTFPILAFYLPARLSRAREATAVRRALRGPDARLEELLALRAAYHLPYHVLTRVSADPLADIAAGRHEALAAAELARLGLPSHVVRGTAGDRRGRRPRARGWR
ncbi:MAG: hypothetical protein M3N16_00790 [Actinomycetota bacterium]|nr:hypothetical protein [Actinomycetota bacterium]